jgi:hypothetical protein
MKISETHRFAKMDGKKVLSRAYVRIPEDKTKPLHVFRVWTRKDCRRKGFATGILSEIVAKFGSREMLLRVSPKKGSGLTKDILYKFYGKFGFVRKGNTQTMIREVEQ